MEIIELPIEEIVEKYESGISTLRLGHEYGVSDTTILKRIDNYYEKIGKKRNKKKAGRKRKVLPVEEIVKKYERGISALCLAHDYGVSESLIFDRIKEYNKTRNEKIKNLENVSILVEYLNKGLTIKEILESASKKNITISSEVIDKALSQISNKNFSDDNDARD